MDNHRLITLGCTFDTMTLRITITGIQVGVLGFIFAMTSCGDAVSPNQASQRRLTISQDESTCAAITQSFEQMLACRQRVEHECALSFLPDFMFETTLQRDSTLLSMQRMTGNGVHLTFSSPHLYWVSPWHKLSVGQACLASFNLNQVVELHGFSRDRADDYEEVVRATYGKANYQRSDDGMAFSINAPVNVFTFTDCGEQQFCFLNEDYLKSERLQLLFSAEELAPLLDFKRQMR